MSLNWTTPRIIPDPGTASIRARYTSAARFRYVASKSGVEAPPMTGAAVDVALTVPPIFRLSVDPKVPVTCVSTNCPPGRAIIVPVAADGSPVNTSPTTAAPVIVAARIV